MTRPEGQGVAVFTIGHSTKSAAELIAALQAFAVRQVADVRTIPKSRHNPQFNQEELKASLQAARMGYLHLPGLGGLRHARKDSPNQAWRNASFRGFADYMQTAEFEESLGKLIKLASQEATAVMCAEAVPWRCHRSLIADALLVRGCRVTHILGSGTGREHALTPWARVEGEKITYPLTAEVS